MSPYGTVDIRLLTSSTAVVAAGNFTWWVLLLRKWLPTFTVKWTGWGKNYWKCVGQHVFELAWKVSACSDECIYCALIDWLMIAYIVLFSALLSRLTALTCGSTWVTSFIAHFLNIHRSGVLTVLAWLMPHETAAVSAQVLCTPYNHAPCHFMQSHIRKVYACLAVTCHLHFWQNDRDLLRATAL